MGWSDNDAKEVENVIGREEEPARHGSAAIAKISAQAFL